MSGSGRESLPDVRECREALQDVREWSGVLPRCPGVVGRTFQLFGSGQVAFPDDWEWSGDPTG